MECNKQNDLQNHKELNTQLRTSCQFIVITRRFTSKVYKCLIVSYKLECFWTWSTKSWRDMEPCVAKVCASVTPRISGNWWFDHNHSMRLLRKSLEGWGEGWGERTAWEESTTTTSPRLLNFPTTWFTCRLPHIPVGSQTHSDVCLCCRSTTANWTYCGKGAKDLKWPRRSYNFFKCVYIQWPTLTPPLLCISHYSHAPPMPLLPLPFPSHSSHSLIPCPSYTFHSSCAPPILPFLRHHSHAPPTPSARAAPDPSVS